tara:strand:- start:1687 stop:2340 length:654 start_codon:yes stop_codon:yes gene_type:complete
MKPYLNFKKELEQAVLKANRNIEEVRLISVSKKKPANLINEVIASGCMIFGENQIQEVEEKWTNIKKEHPDVLLHFIGGIQSRKTKDIFKSCDAIHSIDREKIVKKIKECEEEFNTKKEYFIQVNTGDEPQKSGVNLNESESFINKCINEHNLEVKGLMCIPPQNVNPEEHFLKLRDIGKNFNLPFLSMGMSEDFEIAIRCGATHIRVGTKIFGERH